MWVPRGGCRPLQPTRSTPHWHRRQAIPPAGFGLLPVRSPLLRESSLFLEVLRCFSSPGALPGSPGCPAVRRAGCPIRTSPDRWLPAPPRGISPRGRVLHRPPTPRHPPCAHHADVLRHVPSGHRRRHDRRPARASGTCPSGRDAQPAAPHPRCLGGVVFLSLVCCVLQCARASGHEPLRGLAVSRGRRTQRVPRGALSRCFTTRRSWHDPEVVKTRTSWRSVNLVRRRLPPSDELSPPLVVT